MKRDSHPHAPNALTASPHRFVESISEPVFMIDTAGRVIAVNRRALRLFGFNHDELLYQDIDVVLPVARPGTTSDCWSVILAQPPRDDARFELTARSKEGNEFPAEIVARRIGTDYDSTTTIAIHVRTEQTLTDIEPPHQVATSKTSDSGVESAVFELAHILDTINTGIMILDRDWRYTYINDEGARLTRRDRESLIGKRIWDEFPEAVGSTFYHKYHEAFDNQVGVEFEAYVEPTGTWYEVHVHPSPTGLFVYFQDVSQQRLDVEQLRFQSEILSQITNAVARTDAQGRIRYWNSAAERLFGYSSEEVLGRPWQEITRFEWINPEHERAANDELAASGTWQGETRHYRRDGTPIIVMSSVRQLTDQHGAPDGRIAVMRDFTRRREVERELQSRLKQQAVIAELSGYALSGTNLDRIFDQAVRLLVSTLDVDFAKILELVPQGNALLLRAGTGWRPDSVGNVIVGVGAESQAGFTLLSQEPVIVEDLRTESRFSGPDLLTDHDVVSGMSVVIGDVDHPFGILAVHSQRLRHFSQDDVHFLQAVAGLLATTIERRKAEVALRTSEASLRQQAQILDQIHDAVVSTDLDGIITSWNKGALQLFGYRTDEVIGQPISMLYRDVDHDYLQHEIIDRLKEQGTLEVETRMRRKDDQDVVAHLALSTLRDDSGKPAGLIGYSIDITDRVRAEAERQELLAREQSARQVAEKAAEAARRLQVVTDTKLAHLALDDLLGRLLDTIRDLLAVDTLAILLPSDDGEHLSVRVARGIEEADLDSSFESIIGRGMSGNIASTGLPMVIDDVASSELRSPLLRARIRSAIGVPLLIEERVIGVLRAGTVEPRQFTQDDLRLLQIVADRLALAIDRARLAEAERAARTEADASNLLASSLDYELALRDLAESAVPDLADWCSIFIREESGQIHMLALAVSDASQRDLAERFEQCFSLDLDRSAGVPNVFRTGEAEIVRSVSADRLQRQARNSDEIELLRAANLSSVINVPLRGGGNIIGVMSFTSTDSARRYGDADLILVQDLAKRASLAIDNGRLYRAAQRAIKRAEQQAEQLRQLTSASLLINAALSLDEALQAITDQARAITGAHMAVTSLTMGGSWAQAITATSLSDRYAQWHDYEANTDGTGIYHLVCSTNRPMRLTQAELEAHPDFHGFGAHAAEHPPLRGWLAVPLVDRTGKNIGLVQLSDKDEGEFSDSDEQILLQLAQIAAIAIENADLYREVQQALKIRDQFLSIASHELKTPLTTVKGYVQLLNRYLHRPEMERAHMEESVQELQQQVRRLEVLLSDLLDSSRIQQGRLNLRPGPMDLSSLARQVLTRFEQAMERRDSHKLILDAPVPVEGVWDYDRLDQVLSNLISNALKYSPEGGEVRLSVRRDGDGAEVTVSDQGIGISPEDQKRLFEPFTRSETARRTADGTGLGLYITRQMIEQHGGVITVDSNLGTGTTFTLRLPDNPSVLD